MLRQAWEKIGNAERRLRRSFGKDISTPAARRLSMLHYHLFDHAWLREFWTNFHEIAPGVYRSNQPTARRFAAYKALGIETVVNLRGEDKFSFYLFERETCEKLGLEMIDAKLWARMASSRKRILHVIEVLRTARRPLVFHCKSGADRTGLAGAIYLLVFEGATVPEARRQLGLRYIHLDFTKTGIQDYIIAVFEARLGMGEIGFEDWIAQEYDHKPVQRHFDRKLAPDVCARALIEAAA